MGKVRTTAKELKNSFYRKYYVGYCDLQYLLACIHPCYYTCGVYGWNFDGYVIDYFDDLPTILLTAGYRGMLGERLQNIKKYEETASKIYSDWDIDFSMKKQKLLKLLHDLLKENINLNKGVN